MRESQICRALRSPARTTLVALVLAALSAGVADAGQPGATVALPHSLRAAADTYLPGVVGEPVAGFTLDPDLASLSPGSRTYRIVSGPNAGKTEQHTIAAIPHDESTSKGQDSAGEGWRYTVGDRVLSMKVVPGESLDVVREQDKGQGVMTQYSPAEPLLIAGMSPGDSRTMQIKVAVYDLDDPTDLQHAGSLDLTLSYVGAYKVTVPAGTYDAALLVWKFKGKVGPATVDEIEARFVAPHVGMVAAAEKRDVAAMLIYRDKSKVGKVLQQP